MGDIATQRVACLHHPNSAPILAPFSSVLSSCFLLLSIPVAMYWVTFSHGDIKCLHFKQLFKEMFPCIPSANEGGFVLVYVCFI